MAAMRLRRGFATKAGALPVKVVLSLLAIAGQLVLSPFASGYGTTMEAKDMPAEKWASHDDVQQLLAYMLCMPLADHRDAIQGVLKDDLREGHVHGLLRQLAPMKPSDWKKQKWAGSTTSSKAAALHIWLYHLLDGREKKLVPPEAPYVQTEFSRLLKKDLDTALDVNFKAAMDAARAADRRSADGSSSRVDEIRQAPFDPGWVRLRLKAPSISGADSGGGGGGGGGGGNSTEWEHQTSAIYAFLMGTHEKSTGYASRDEPCAVRLVAHSEDLLRLIAAHVRGTTRPELRPPPREVRILREKLRTSEARNHHSRQVAEVASLLGEEDRTVARRALAREAYTAGLLETAEQRIEELEAQLAKAEGRASKAEGKLETERTAHNAERRMWREDAADVQERLAACDEERTAALGDLDASHKAEKVRLAAERTQAARSLAATEAANQQLQQQAERLHRTSKAQLQAELAEAAAALKAKSAELTAARARRTGTMKRVSELNLLPRRLKLAEQRADKCQEELADYCMEDLGLQSAMARADAAEKQLAEVQQAFEEAQAAAEKYKAIAVPPEEKFFKAGAYTMDVDLTALELIAELGVSPSAVPKIFTIMGRFYEVTIPSVERFVQDPTVDGKRTYVKRQLLRIPGRTHCKELPAIGGELHKMQVAEWLLEDADADYCYVADGANSQQREILAQILFRRNKATGKLESMAMSIDRINDKTAEGQQRKFVASLEAIAEAWEEADELGLLASVHDEAAAATDAAAGGAAADATADATAATDADADAETADGEQSAAAFHEQRRKVLRAKLRGKIAGLRATSTMNDRNAGARKAARLARGGNGSGGEGDVLDDPTCAHHAVANIGEDGRKAIDKRLKGKMNITEEQSESDASKVKALRTNVGWFSSPACSLIYQVCKYVALFSSKGYAIGANFAQWLAHKLKTTERVAGELIGHVEDLLAICGGRDYVFYLDAGVVDRFSQLESLYGYLLEEADLGAEAGGKLRKAIITGFESVYCMAAVKSMAIIADAWLWPMLRAIEPGDEVHILDVCPALWPRTLAWLEEAAANPQSAIDGSLSLRASFEGAGLRTTPRREPSATGRKRSERAAADLQRIRTAIEADDELKVEVHAMLTDAFTAMGAGVRNHAAEFMADGAFCSAKITPEMRKRLDGMPLTSVAAETMFARVKRRADRGGRARHDTRMGAVLCERDRTVGWARGKADPEALKAQARKRLREGSGSRTMADEDALDGAAKAPERTAKIAKKRKGRAAKAAELERLKGVTLAATYSALKKLRNDELSDQLKVWKLVEKKGDVKKTTGNRTELVRALQPLILERFDAKANDLEAGDDGLWGEALRRRKATDGEGGGKGGKGGKGKKRGRGKQMVTSECGQWEWEATARFDIERLIGKMVADGKTPIPGRTNVVRGTILYKVLWEGFPPEHATWEEADNLHDDYIDAFEEALKGGDGQGDDDDSDDDE